MGMSHPRRSRHQLFGAPLGISGKGKHQNQPEAKTCREFTTDQPAPIAFAQERTQNRRADQNKKRGGVGCHASQVPPAVAGDHEDEVTKNRE